MMSVCDVGGWGCLDRDGNGYENGIGRDDKFNINREPVAVLEPWADVPH